MRFALTEDQLALRDAVTDVLRRECPPAVVRASAVDAAAVRPVWNTLAEMGVLDALASEASGGMGFSLSEAIPLARAAGVAALPAPFVEHVFIAAPLLGAQGTAMVTATDSDLLPYAHIADRALVLNDSSVVEIPSELFGTGMPLETTVDAARPLARIPSIIGESASVGTAEPARTAAQLGTAATLVGLAQTMLDLTVAYVQERKQFGVAIGTFQAVKHHLSNVRIAIEFADPMISAAAWAVDSEAPDAALLAAFAKLRANACAALAAETCLQCHGAIGYSYEHDLQLWMKRAWALRTAWGSDTQLREIAGAALSLSPTR